MALDIKKEAGTGPPFSFLRGVYPRPEHYNRGDRAKESVTMASCPECGKKMKKSVDICPSCGYSGGVQTITDLPAAKVRRKKKEPRPDIPRKDREEVCVNCRTPIPGNLNICPKCGLSGGAQTMTDLPPWKE